MKYEMSVITMVLLWLDYLVYDLGNRVDDTSIKTGLKVKQTFHVTLMLKKDKDDSQHKVEGLQYLLCIRSSTNTGIQRHSRSKKQHTYEVHQQFLYRTAKKK